MGKFIKIDEWKSTKEDRYVLCDGRIIIIPFDEIFNKPNITALNNFIIKKESYSKRLPELTHYINYFIKYYDYDNELLLTYLKLKYMIDNKTKHIGVDTFIKLLYNLLFSESMKAKIIKLVEDNYYIDLSAGEGINYNESLEFTEEHAKVLMQISMSMKLMVPVMFHYLNTYGKIKDRKYIYRFYEDLFYIYGGDINIYNKLFISIWSKVHVNYIRNKIIWEQRKPNNLALYKLF